ncbi:MAG: XdhC family protein [Pseudomonadales bacterium]
MKRKILDQLQQDRGEKRAVALVTRLADAQQALVYANQSSSGELPLSEPEKLEVSTLLKQGNSGKVADSGDENQLFVRSYLPPYRLILVGAVHIAQYLAPMAQAAGYEVIIIDPRFAFVTEERFAGLPVLCEWPDEVLPELAPDRQTALVTLTHDPKIDDIALMFALRCEVFYIGALGSRRTHASRVERMRNAGLADEIDRICGPVGLSLGGRAPSEIAVSILAQLIQHRYGEPTP